MKVEYKPDGVWVINPSSHIIDLIKSRISNPEIKIDNGQEIYIFKPYEDPSLVRQIFVNEKCPVNY